MNKITRKKSQDYTIMSNVFLQDKNLSIKAKGFLAVVMGLPDDWEFSIRGVCTILKEGKSAVYNVIDELKENGYCIVSNERNDHGLFAGNDYTFYEEPHTEEPHTENRDTDNRTQLNTNTIKDITNKVPKESKDESLPKKFDFKKALLDLGVGENVANDFLLVRKNKKATNSETAFRRIQTEIAKSGLSANECITIAVENDWKGFRADWLGKTGSKYGSTDRFLSYTPQKMSDRAMDYISTLTVPVQVERNGIKFLTDGTYIENGKRYYSHKTKGVIEISMGAVARPSEDWEWNSNMLTWEKDERKTTISDMLF